ADDDLLEDVHPRCSCHGAANAPPPAVAQRGRRLGSSASEGGALDGTGRRGRLALRHGASPLQKPVFRPRAVLTTPAGPLHLTTPIVPEGGGVSPASRTRFPLCTGGAGLLVCPPAPAAPPSPATRQRPGTGPAPGAG